MTTLYRTLQRLIGLNNFKELGSSNVEIRAIKVLLTSGGIEAESKQFFNELTDIVPNYVPVFLVKNSLNAIRPKGFKRVDILDCALDLHIGNQGT